MMEVTCCHKVSHTSGIAILSKKTLTTTDMITAANFTVTEIGPRIGLQCPRNSCVEQVRDRVTLGSRGRRDVAANVRSSTTVRLDSGTS